MKIWWKITDRERRALIRLQLKMFNSSLNPPAPEERPPVHVEGEIETPEEIDRIIRQPPSRSHDKDGE